MVQNIALHRLFALNCHIHYVLAVLILFLPQKESFLIRTGIYAKRPLGALENAALFCEGRCLYES